MISPPTMAPGIEVKPPRISTGSALSAIRLSENCTPDFAPHITPATSATSPAIDQVITQIVAQRDPDRQRRLVVVGHRPQRPAGAGVLREERQRGHQHAARPRAATMSSLSMYMPQ